MGVSCGYQRRHQRWAWHTKAAAAATKKPVCKHRTLSTPPLPGACAARHCQGPVIQGQLPQENTQRTSGWCNVTLASATAGSPHIPYPSLPQAWVSQSPRSSCFFNPILSEQRTDALRWPTCRGEANPKLNPRSCANKEEKGNFSVQPQEQQIKSPKSTWCTLHLWNTWIDNESSKNWGGGLWEQL